jgi:hypothetical protein
VVHVAPLVRPHAPALQTPTAHCDAVVHASPLAPMHRPPVQAFDAHPEFTVHAAPAGLPQTPEGEQVPEAHCVPGSDPTGRPPAQPWCFRTEISRIRCFVSSNFVLRDHAGVALEPSVGFSTASLGGP